MSKLLSTSRKNPVPLCENGKYSDFKNNKVMEGKTKDSLPAMGWNSWNAFGSGNNEELTKAMADKIKELELDKLGYKYIVLDDGCYKSERVDGKLSNNEKFPSGFRALADYLHNLGLKFGMYNDIGTNLCAGAEVGTCGFEEVDAKSYIDWDIDFIKIDNCYYLWDNATHSLSTNAKYVYAPDIQSVTIKAEDFEVRLNAVTDGKLYGNGATKCENCVTNIGTFDGTNVGRTPVGAQSGELHFTINAPNDGEYNLSLMLRTDEKIGTGRWLQVAVGDEMYFDAIIENEAGKFSNYGDIKIKLKKGENTVRIMNHRRQENTLASYTAMLNSLNAIKADNGIVMSICEWGKTQPQNWGYKVGNSWRILNDITFMVGNEIGNIGTASWATDNTASITSQYSKAVVMDEFAGLDKGWNDPDMLVVGMDGINETMCKTHMSMWCMMNSPLMLGMDLRRMTKGDTYYNIIANKDIIALNQDALGVQAKRVYCSLTNKPDKEYIIDIDRIDILAKPLFDGSIAVSFVNVSDKNCNKETSVELDTILKYIKVSEEFKNAKGYKVKDLWTKEEYHTENKFFSVPKLDACDSVTIKISYEK